MITQKETGEKTIPQNDVSTVRNIIASNDWLAEYQKSNPSAIMLRTGFSYRKVQLILDRLVRTRNLNKHNVYYSFRKFD